MNDLEYFERLIRDLNDARQQQLAAYESLNFKNALNLASAKIEMMKIASNSSKNASDAAKIHAEKKESQSQSLEESSQKPSTLKVEKKIRKVGERPISIKSQRLNMEDPDGS